MYLTRQLPRSVDRQSVATRRSSDLDSAWTPHRKFSITRPSTSCRRLLSGSERQRTDPLSNRLQDVLGRVIRSEEHTSELQSRQYRVGRLLHEKKETTVTLLHLRLTC